MIAGPTAWFDAPGRGPRIDYSQRLGAVGEVVPLFLRRGWHFSWHRLVMSLGDHVTDANGHRIATADLLHRVRARDRAAWGLLTDFYAPLVYHWARSLGSSPAEGGTVVADVFRALAMWIDMIDPEEEERGLCGWLWMLTTTEIRQRAIRGTVSYADEVPLRSATSSVKTFVDDASAFGAAASISEPETPGLKQLRQYQLVAKLGEGGMGEIYKAVHIELQKFVALKLLTTDRASNERGLESFHREMRAAGRLDHPNIIRANDAGEMNGIHFLVMEYVDGVDVQRLLDRLGPLPLVEACEITRQAAEGLQHVYEHGLIHRDIKPSNLMVSTAGVVKILDLGLAVLPEHTDENADESRLVGTIDFMAPEQAEYSYDVTIRADIYGLGATLYKILTGRAPLADSRLTTPLRKMVALAKKPVPPVQRFRADVPLELAETIARMLAKRPDDRFQTPAEVAAVMGRFAAGSQLPTLVSRALLRSDDATHADPSDGTTATAFPRIGPREP